MTNEEEKYTTLDTEQCKWWVNQLFGIAKEKACNSHNFDDAEEMQSAQDKIIKALEIVEEFEKAQIITGGRLNGRTYAYKCGLEDGKRKALEQQPSEDCVSRQAVLDEIKLMSNANPSYWATCDVIDREDLIDSIKDLPPVTPIFPKGATNGDMIKAMFPNAETWVEYDSSGDVMRFDIAENSTLECFNLEWWDAPYKGGVRNESVT